MVSGYAERAAAATDSLAPVVGLLAYLDAAAVVENGLAPAQIVVAQNRVQVLTVHAAKGLEWQVVAVPHLSGGLFPSTAQARTWVATAPDGPRFDRYVRIDGPDGAMCAQAKTTWCLIEQASGRPKRVPPEIVARFV